MKFLTWNEKLGRPECPYLVRWALNLHFISFRLHHWLSGDDDRAFHDHPSSMLIVVLAGGYTDVNEGGSERMTPGTIRFRRAEYKHTVDVDKGGCWTFVIFGRQTRKWGFWRRRPDGSTKFIKANKWFLEEGAHPCNLK